MKKIYIAGKISGLPFKETAIKFAEAYAQIQSMKFEPVNPIEIVQDAMVIDNKLLSVAGDEIWKEAMKICIKKLIECDGIILLPDWKESRGAFLEYKISVALEIPIFHYTPKGLILLRSFRRG